jgi:hypothetical protein
VGWRKPDHWGGGQSLVGAGVAVVNVLVTAGNPGDYLAPLDSSWVLDCAPPARRVNCVGGHWMTHAYTLRYGCTYRPGQPALIVQDEAGTSYLFAGGVLQAQLSARLSTLAELSTDWLTVSDSTSYSLTGLRQLTALPRGGGAPGKALAQPQAAYAEVMHGAA